MSDKAISKDEQNLINVSQLRLASSILGDIKYTEHKASAVGYNIYNMVNGVIAELEKDEFVLASEEKDNLILKLADALYAVCGSIHDERCCGECRPRENGIPTCYSDVLCEVKTLYPDWEEEVM